MSMFRRMQPAVVLAVVIGFAAPGFAADTDKYLPGSADAVVTINVKQILSSPLLKDHIDQLKSLLAVIDDAQKVLKDVGFDPFTDIDQVILAGGKDTEKALVMVTGKFDTSKLHAKAEEVAKEKKDELKITKAGSYTIYETKSPDSPQTMYVAFLDNATVATSPSKDMIVEALDKKSGTKKSDVKKDLLDLLGKADAKKSVSIAALASNLPAGGQGAQIIEKIQFITGTIDINTDVNAQVVLTAKNAQDAASLEKTLKDGLDQGKGLIALMANNDKQYAPLVDVMNSLKVATAGTSVTLDGMITKKLIDEVIKQQKGQ